MKSPNWPLMTRDANVRWNRLCEVRRAKKKSSSETVNPPTLILRDEVSVENVEERQVVPPAEFRCVSYPVHRDDTNIETNRTAIEVGEHGIRIFRLDEYLLEINWPDTLLSTERQANGNDAHTATAFGRNFKVTLISSSEEWCPYMRTYLNEVDSTWCPLGGTITGFRECNRFAAF